MLFLRVKYAEIINNCHDYFFPATVNLDILERNITRPNIDCPGDTLSYNCSVVMNTDRVDLTWIITLPGQIPISITYDNTSVLDDLDYLDESVITTLTEYRSDEYIESIATIIVMSNITLNQSKIECTISNQKIESIIAFVNTSGTNLHIIFTDVLRSIFLNSSSGTYWLQNCSSIFF